MSGLFFFFFLPIYLIIKEKLMTDYNLNQGQGLAGDAFFAFLFTDQVEFNISGFAGTGKTHLMSYIIDQTMPRYYEMCKLIGIKPQYTDVVMTATTNKAAEVLQETTKRPTQTIHSFLNLKVKEDYVTGRMNLEKTTNWRVHENKIIFVDEASMVDTALHTILHEGTHNCKIIYVGDHSQLAPVMEKISPVYLQNSPFYELTEQMRNSAYPDLMAVCQQLRETVNQGDFKPIKIVPGVIDLLDGVQMENHILSYFTSQTDTSRILAYTNKRVIQYNEHIRTIRNLPDSYQAGELLVNNSAISLRSRRLSVEQGIEVITNKGTNLVHIDPTTDMSVDVLDIRTTLGERFDDILVPTDRNHYDQLLKYYKRQKNWSKYYDMKQTYPELRPRDAATVHKAQGSTYDTVFIDLGNISECHQPNQVARMLYVAFSRAKTRVFLYGQLADKYGGLIQ